MLQIQAKTLRLLLYSHILFTVHFIVATHKLVTIAFCPRVIDDYGRESNKTAERSLLINLAIDYIEVRNWKKKN